MTVISKDEFKVFYGVRKTTRVATIAEAHEAIKDSRNVVALPPNAGDPGNQDSNTEKVSAESIEEIYEPAGELEIEEDLKSDGEAKPPLPTSTKRRRQDGNKSLVLKELFKGKN